MAREPPVRTTRKTGDKPRRSSGIIKNRKAAAATPKPAAPREPSPLPDTAALTDLPLPPALLATLATLPAPALTPLHRTALPALLAGRDLAALTPLDAATATTLLLPITAHLLASRSTPRHGPAAIILTPTRESALTLASLASTLLAGAPATVGILADSHNKLSEAEKLERGLNLLIATPTRLLEHLRELPSLATKNIRSLVLYGADTLLAGNAVATVLDIAAFLPRSRNTVIVAEQETDSVHGAVELLTRPAWLTRVAAPPAPAAPAVEKIAYVLVPPADRALLLLSFLRVHSTARVLVLTSSSPAAAFLAEACAACGFDAGVLHARNIAEHARVLGAFAGGSSGVLIAAQEVLAAAAPDLRVDWTLQFDPPSPRAQFLHVAAEHTVLFLAPHEEAYLRTLPEGVGAEEFGFPRKALATHFRAVLEKAVKREYALNVAAKDAFRAYVREYAALGKTKEGRKVWCMEKLDVVALARGFGLEVPPRVELGLEEEKRVDTVARPYGPDVGKARAKPRRANV